MKKFYIKYKTLGMTLFAGCLSSTSIDSIKSASTDLIARRHIRKLDDAWIEDESGNVKAVLNMGAYNRIRKIGEARIFEWLTVR